MQFNRLMIENVGNFLGRHEFDLCTSEERPITLFGGLNGAGKTTIFEAIKLCLYGSEMFRGMSAVKYNNYLRSKTHKSKSTKLPIDSSAIELEFDYIDFGGTSHFIVSRAWELTPSNVKESFRIKKNGLPLDDIEKEYFQDFIKEMIPLGLSELFFFDGEKIRRMMSDDKSHELRNSILSLLGLDVVERLQADLKIYRSKHLLESKSRATVDTLDSHEKAKLAIETKIEELEVEKASLENSLKKAEDQLSRFKSKMAAQGEGYFKKRTFNEERKQTLERALEQIKDKLRELASGCLPVVIAEQYTNKLKDQIQKEKQSQVSRSLEVALSDKRDALLDIIENETFLDEVQVSKESEVIFKKGLSLKIKELFQNNSGNLQIQEIFGFSEKQTVEILSTLEVAQRDLPSQITKFSNIYEDLYRQLQEVVSLLNRTPDEEFIQPMYETLQELENTRGGLFRRKEELNSVLFSYHNEIAELDRHISTINKKIAANEKVTEKLEKVTKVQNVLEKYYKELTRKKISLLQIEFSKAFNLLHRKEDMISRVEIDPDTCAVSIYDANGSMVKRSTLSSGELEIYAISMLWALAKTSGQKLPFIIDTPLARLDSKHRDNLIQYFLPVASHQVMVFSTNTEVDQHYFNLLRPHISHSYNLDYDETAQRTVVKDGYFWN